MGNAESSSGDYVLDDPLLLEDDDVAWKLHQAITREGTQMSVFVYDETTVPEGAKKHMDQYVDNAVKVRSC